MIATPNIILIRLCLLLVLCIATPQLVEGFDSRFEGRALLGSSYVFDLSSDLKDFDSEAELRLGVLGNAWQGEVWQLDYELTGDVRQVDGPSVQSHLQPETNLDFFRAWLRLDNGSFKIRGGRQKILFGAGTIYRPLGFFDTRNVTGVVPLTRGADGFRSTWFVTPSSFLEGWLVPAKKDSSFIAGLRGETLIGDMEVGAVVQYHPRTDLTDLADFDQEMVQLGYHLKGEMEIGFWNESRMDIELESSSPLRFDTVLGVDYTFNLGEGLHVLMEYFLTTRQKDFTLTDPKGQRTIQQIGFTMDQPVGIDIRWQVFSLYDLRDKSFQVIPQIEYSVTESLFLYLHGRVGGNLKEGEKDGRLHRKSATFNGTESILGLTLISYF